ncbi:conserved membrane hypothetical protein [Candidatus Terasakiella magnetica]|nr:conserved membrane hypothetical protein [Candidatus Terasakiella magnetica]
MTHDTNEIAPLAHHGGTGAMIRLAVINLLLSIATLSIWRFWGKTKVRQALWSNTTAWDDPLEYTGTGKELFLGFVIILIGVYVPLVLLFNTANALIAEESPLGGLLMVLLYVVTIFLIAAGSFRARRYQLSRTVWRGIRGGQGGSAWAYAWRSLAVWALVPLTLGWIWPWGDMMLARYRLNHTTFGNTSFTCEAGLTGLYKRFTLLWVGWMGLFAAGGALAFAMAAAVMAAGTGGDWADIYFVVSILMFILVVPVIVISLAWYRAGFYQRLAEGTALGGVRFRLETGAWGLMRLGIGNGFLVALSLGVLRPWAALRMWRFACDAIRLDGVPDFAAIRQAVEEGPTLGEGLSSVLDSAGEY